MTTTLEKAARALSESLANDGVPVIHEQGAEPHTVHLFLGDLPTFAVIAVLKAIREPTPDVVEAGNDEQHDDDCTDLRLVWRAMIDSIIGEVA